MNIHEYQAKACCASSACRCRAACRPSRVDEAIKAAQELAGPVWAAKAQIDAGGAVRPGASRWPNPSRRDVKKPAVSSARLWSRMRPAARQEGTTGSISKRLGDRSRVLSLGADRPRNLGRRLRRFDRRRHGHRGGRAQHAGKDHHLFRRSGDRHHAASRPPRCAGAGARPAIWPNRSRPCCPSSMPLSSPRI